MMPRQMHPATAAATQALAGGDRADEGGVVGVGQNAQVAGENDLVE